MRMRANGAYACVFFLHTGLNYQIYFICGYFFIIKLKDLQSTFTQTQLYLLWHLNFNVLLLNVYNLSQEKLSKSELTIVGQLQTIQHYKKYTTISNNST